MRGGSPEAEAFIKGPRAFPSAELTEGCQKGSSKVTSLASDRYSPPRPPLPNDLRTRPVLCLRHALG